MKRKMAENNADEERIAPRARGTSGSGESYSDDSDGSCESFTSRAQHAENNSFGNGDTGGDVAGGDQGGGNIGDENGDYEEECVICLEDLSSEDWGRVTPCGHAFHKKCWWEWENAHNERVDRQRQQNPRYKSEGPKCCLCNTVNKQFVDGDGAPAHNPSPYVASEDPGDAGGNRFSSFFNEASDFMDFLGNEIRDSFTPRRRSSPGTDRRSNGASGSRRGSSFVPPFFGRGNNGNSASPNRNGSPPPFGVPPFFRNRTSPQRPQSYTRRNSGGNPYNLLRSGTQIVTQQLVNSPHLNGRRGQVLQYQPESQRYLVQFETDITNFIAGDNAMPVAIKPQNLLQTAKVKIQGLRSQPQLNGKEGTITAYSPQRNRYVVQVGHLLSPTRDIAIQPTNIRIPDGTCVRLEGLQRTPHWNGKYGTIMRWVQDQNDRTGTVGRYEVALSRQYAVRVRMENVRL